VFDGIAVGVEDAGVEVAERLVTGFAPVGEAHVAVAEREFGVRAGEDDEREFRALRVVRFAAVREIENHRAVEHRAFALGHAFQTGDDFVHDLHVVQLGAVADFLRSEAADGLAVR